MRDAGGGLTDQLLFRAAVSRIESHNSSSPLFLYVAYQAAHAPMLEPPRRYRRTYHQSPHFRSLDEEGSNRYATITVRLAVMFSSENGEGVLSCKINISNLGFGSRCWRGDQKSEEEWNV